MRKIGLVLAPLAALALVLSLVVAALPALAAGEVELIELWHKAYDSGYGDCAHDVAVDSEDNVIVTGYTTNETGNTNYYTIKYDKDGNEIWSKSYDGGNNDEAYSVAVDSEDNIIVTGYSSDGSTYNYYTIKYETVPVGCGGLCGYAIAGIGIAAFTAGGLISYFIIRRRPAG